MIVLNKNWENKKYCLRQDSSSKPSVKLQKVYLHPKNYNISNLHLLSITINNKVRKNNKLITQFFLAFSTWNFFYMDIDLKQGSQTRGLRAACGPPDAFVRPTNNPKKWQNFKFWSNLAYFGAFLGNCGPQKLFFY